MAQPISMPLPVRDSRAELKMRLEQAPAEHAEALLACYEIIEGLHRRGALELLRGGLGSAEKVLEIAIDVTRAPQSIRSLRNLLVLLNFVGEIDPDRLKILTKSGAEVLTTPEPQKPPSLWSIFWTLLCNRDVRRSLGFGLNLLKSFGRNLAPSSGDGTAKSEPASFRQG
jgi:uncharacterized protein YjgD (DUF1641 family)